jgi:hypothetical protein
MKWYHWIGLGLLGLLAVAVLIASGGQIKIPVKELKESIEAEGEAKKLEAELGRDKASEAIKAKHKQLLEELDEDEREEVERLSGNPTALSKALLRAGRKAFTQRV